MTIMTELGVPLEVLIEDTCHNLCMRGHLDPDAEEWPDEVVRELAELWQQGACDICPGWGNPDALADHWLRLKQDEYERTLPVWTCDCGARFKVIPELGNREHFFAARDDGLLGDEAGGIHRDGMGRVKKTDACPACGRTFAEVITRQAGKAQSLSPPAVDTRTANTQQSLF